MARKVDVGAEADKLKVLRDAHKRAADAEKAAKQALDEQKEKVMQSLSDAGLDKGSGKHITAAIYEEEVYGIDDDEKFFRYLFRNKMPQLLQRRVSNPAVREIEQQRRGRPIPGLKKTTLRKLSVTER